MGTAFRETLHCSERVDGNNTARSLMLFGTYSAINMFQIFGGWGARLQGILLTVCLIGAVRRRGTYDSRLVGSC